MYLVLFKTARAQVAVQALCVLESTRYRDRIRRCADVLYVDPLQPLHLVLQRAVDAVVPMARITGHVRRHSMILKMLRGNMTRIIYVKASAIGSHNVTRNAELRLFGALHVRVHPAQNAKSREHAQRNEGHYLPACRARQRRTNQKDSG